MHCIMQPAEAIGLPKFDAQRMSPEPVRIPRNRLDQQLAVLLMRSVYDAVDMLDFISMVIYLVLSVRGWII